MARDAGAGCPRLSQSECEHGWREGDTTRRVPSESSPRVLRASQLPRVRPRDRTCLSGRHKASALAGRAAARPSCDGERDLPRIPARPDRRSCLMVDRSQFRDSYHYALAVASEIVAPGLRLVARAASRSAPTAPASWRTGVIIGQDHIGDVLYRTCSLEAL